MPYPVIHASTRELFSEMDNTSIIRELLYSKGQQRGNSSGSLTVRKLQELCDTLSLSRKDKRQELIDRLLGKLQ